MKPIESTFNRSGFTYSLVKRDGDAAMFTKSFTNKPDGPKWFEVIKIILDEEGDEAFPAPTSWGILALTLPEAKQAEAEAKYAQLVAEYGAEALGEEAHPVDKAAFVQVDNSKTPQSDPFPAKLPEPTVVTTPAVAVAGKAARGRKKLDVKLDIPETGTFQARELADASGMSVPFVHNRLKNLVEQGVLEIHERVQGKRGKPVILFKKKGAKV